MFIIREFLVYLNVMLVLCLNALLLYLFCLDVQWNVKRIRWTTCSQHRQFDPVINWIL